MEKFVNYNFSYLFDIYNFNIDHFLQENLVKALLELSTILVSWGVQPVGADDEPVAILAIPGYVEPATASRGEATKHDVFHAWSI